MLILNREEAIEHFVDEIMFNVSRDIWDLLLLEVFPQETHAKFMNPVIMPTIRYLFCTLPAVRCVTINELDKVMGHYSRGATDRTVRALRETIVGYEMTDDDYRKLLEKPSSEETIRDYIVSVKQERRPEGVGWFMAIQHKGKSQFFVYPYDKGVLSCRAQTTGGSEERSEENGNHLVTSTRQNIKAVWRTAVTVYKMLHDNNRFREELNNDLLTCSADGLEKEAFDYMNSMEAEVVLNENKHEVTPYRMKLLNLIRIKLMEFGFVDDQTLGLFQAKLKAPGKKIRLRRPMPEYDDKWES